MNLRGVATGAIAGTVIVAVVVCTVNALGLTWPDPLAIALVAGAWFVGGLFCAVLWLAEQECECPECESRRSR